MKKAHVLMAMLAVLALSAVSTAQAATITWGAATNIVGDTDVSLEGTLVRADGMHSPVVTVNGVAFADTMTGTSPSWSSSTDSLTTSENYQNPYEYTSGFAGTGKSADYTTLLGGMRNFDGNAATFTLGALTAGHDYLVQVWATESNAYARHVSVDGNVIELNVSQVAGGWGQYRIGRFTADAGTQAFSVVGGVTSQEQPNWFSGLNAWQLRDVTTGNAIPEPAGLGLIGLMLLGLRKRRS